MLKYPEINEDHLNFFANKRNHGEIDYEQRERGRDKPVINPNFVEESNHQVLPVVGRTEGPTPTLVNVDSFRIIKLDLRD